MTDLSMFRGLRARLAWLAGSDRTHRSLPRRRAAKPSLEILEERVVPNTTFDLKDMSGLSPSVGTAWVAGFINGNQVLQANGQFESGTSTSAPFYPVSSIPAVTLLSTQPTNGNDRLVFAVSLAQPANYPLTGYTAYPFNSVILAPPPGPYDIFEFGLNAQDDLSAVDSYGLNLSFTGDPNFPSITYGANPAYTRAQIGSAFTAFTTTDPEGADFSELLYSSPGTNGAPPLVGGEYSAIVSPKDWLAINPSDPLSTYWNATINAFFTTNNQLSIDVGPQQGSGGLDVIYSGSFDGTNYNFTRNLSSDNIPNFGPTEEIPKSQFTSTFVFAQGLPSLVDSGQGSLYDSMLEAFERGVALDGVFTSAKSNGESTTAWNTIGNWYTNHANAYNGVASVYDVYAKFLHTSTINGTDFRTSGGTPILGANQNNNLAQAYGFSLDENPFPTPNPSTGMGTVWPNGSNVPSKTPISIPDGSTLTITLGPYGGQTAMAPAVQALYAVGAGMGGLPEVKVYNPDGSLRLDFLAYNPLFSGGVRVAVGDVNANGVPDIITGPGPGLPPEVKVFSGLNGQLLYDFYAFNPAFTGGIYVGAGDVNGDGASDIVAGMGAGGLPEVKVFGGGPQSGRQLYDFYAYDVAFRGGVTVASGDVNGDGFADLVTGTASGSPNVKVFGGGPLDGQLLRSFFAYDPFFLGGVTVAAGDVNGDGFADLVTGTASGAPNAKVFGGSNGRLLQNFFAFAPSFVGGVQVATTDPDGDVLADLVLGAGFPGAPQVRILDGLSLRELDNFFAFNTGFQGGVSVGAA